MTTKRLIAEYIESQPEPKRTELQALHKLALKALPKCRLWFLDGKDARGKTVTNPNIGYGIQTIEYAGGKTRDFYQVGLSANSSGISVYVIGLKDKKYLAKTYGKKLGKASVTGYCIKFKTLDDIDTGVLAAAMKDGAKQTAQ